ncbi:MAG: hypothetical protein OEV92_06455 [Nitrospinota bacterium]|nr:hypothetical protein [Nitrospinota bacterium]
MKAGATEKVSYSTQSERLVIRYLLNERDTFEKLVQSIQQFAGPHALEVLLDSVNGFLSYDSSYRMDRAYALRGMALERMGRADEAEISYSSSLMLNNHNREARKSLIALHMTAGSLDKALVELDKALRIEKIVHERDFYLSMRKKVYERKELANEKKKGRPFNGLASLPEYALATGHPKAHSG